MPMARDLGKYGIRAVSIAPGSFDTVLLKRVPEKALKSMLNQMPLGRLGQPDEYAHLVTTVIENAYLNGVILRIDGGFKLPNL